MTQEDPVTSSRSIDEEDAVVSVGASCSWQPTISLLNQPKPARRRLQLQLAARALATICQFSPRDSSAKLCREIVTVEHSENIRSAKLVSPRITTTLVYRNQLAALPVCFSTALRSEAKRSKALEKPNTNSTSSHATLPSSTTIRHTLDDRLPVSLRARQILARMNCPSRGLVRPTAEPQLRREHVRQVRAATPSC
ncbi:hypothetical protein Mapa_002277 [Marchantia paleacea]|nr:hypothetical protein Mapa_002277 [Marchantia paleacea]